MAVFYPYHSMWCDWRILLGVAITEATEVMRHLPFSDSPGQRPCAISFDPAIKFDYHGWIRSLAASGRGSALER